METIPEEMGETGEDWQKKCLEQLRTEAKDALSEILLKEDKEENKDTPKTGTRPSKISYASGTAANTAPLPNHVSPIKPPPQPPATADFSPDNDQHRTRRYTTALAGARKLIRKSRKQRDGGGAISGAVSGDSGRGAVRSRAYTTAAPSDTARQVSAISVEFQKLLERKTAQLRAERERGRLTDEQLEEQFMADIGAALRDIADQFREMNQKKAAEMKQQEEQERRRLRQERGRNGGPPPSRLMQAVRSASGRMIALFTNA